MNMFVPLAVKRFSMLGLLAISFWLGACGGTQVAGGVGSGGSGVAEGTVSGFGSVIVDGVTYGDSNASVVRAGETAISEAKLGQRVRVEYDSAQQATRITVLPQLIGNASTAPNAQGEFLLLGQRVRIVGVNDSDLSATVFDGLSQVTAGLPLEVHGNWSQSDGQNLLIASRIERLASTPTTSVLTAPVLSRNGNRLVLDDSGRTAVQASTIPDSVQAGGLVSVWLNSSSLNSTPWVAQQVLDASPQAGNAQTLNLDALVSSSDSNSVRVQGLNLRLPASWSGAAPSAGTAVRVQLERQGNEWVASDLRLSNSSAQAAIQLKGSISWPSSPSTLVLRNTAVDLRAGQALAASCAGLQAGDEVYVSVEASRSAPGQLPQASRVECSVQIPSNSVQEGSGTLLSVSGSAVSVAVRGITLSLSITDRSLMPANPGALLNRSVEIEYQRSGTGYVLRKLKAD